MPGRKLAREGDVVRALWYDDPTWYVGIVKKDEEAYRDGRLYIECPHLDCLTQGRRAENYVAVGYLEDAHEVQLMKPVDVTHAIEIITREELIQCFKDETFREPTESDIDALAEYLGDNFEPCTEWITSVIRRKWRSLVD